MLNSIRLLIIYSALFLLSTAFAEEISASNIKVELISEYDALVPGGVQYLALRMKPDPDWHVYWKYQGDTGTPPKLNFQPQEGIEFESIVWPNPEKIQVGHLVNYGYAEETLLLIPLKVSKSIEKLSSVNLKAKSSWLVCQEECIPGSANLSIDLKVSGSANKTNWEHLFFEARKNLPLKIDNLKVTASIINDTEFVLNLVESPGISIIKNEVLFIPDSGKQIENAAVQEVSIKNKNLSLKLSKAKSDPFPGKISGILLSQNGWYENYPQSIYVESELLNGLQGKHMDASAISIFSAIIFAFLGGVILNLMPCVFPILSIKILGFVNKADKDKSKVYKHGLTFAAGVLVSFWTLAGILISLQAAGYKLGWGFQLQSPFFLLVMIGLLFLVALNLYGFFEIGAKLQNFFGRFSASGYADSFLSGILATVLATPCTAPFMGTAIAISLVSSKLIAFIIFTFLGIGMALPYAVLSASPGLLKLIPKPGAWMEKFKQLLSFPVFATIIWLIGVYLKQAGQAPVIRLLFSLLFIFTAIWILKNLKYLSRTIALLLFLFSIYIAAPTSPGKKEYDWQVYSNKSLTELVSSGKPVFIDFTAEWCLTCKLNKFVALDTEEVRDKFIEKGVVMLKADWTSVDEEISDAIKSYGRSGVPLNVLFYGKGNKEPYIFPAVLTPGVVLSELDRVVTPGFDYKTTEVSNAR